MHHRWWACQSDSTWGCHWGYCIQMIGQVYESSQHRSVPRLQKKKSAIFFIAPNILIQLRRPKSGNTSDRSFPFEVSSLENLKHYHDPSTRTTHQCHLSIRQNLGRSYTQLFQPDTPGTPPTSVPSSPLDLRASVLTNLDSGNTTPAFVICSGTLRIGLCGYGSD